MAAVEGPAEVGIALALVQEQRWGNSLEDTRIENMRLQPGLNTGNTGCRTECLWAEAGTGSRKTT